MSNWKTKTFSLGGRLTIVSNILGNIGTYWLSSFPIPRDTTQRLEALRRNFFWGSLGEGKVISWVKWEKACYKKEHGRLGIIALEDANIALLSKWVRRFKNEKRGSLG